MEGQQVFTYAVQVSCPVSVDETDSGSALTVFPIPADDELSVHLGSIRTIASVTLIDATGRTIELPWMSRGNGLITCDVSSLAPGNYVIALRTNDRSLVGQVMIVR